jgi:hypothetical protein
MPENPACFFGCGDDPGQFGSFDGGVHVGRQAGSQGIAFKDVDEDGHASDDSVWYPRRCHDGVELLDALEQLFHMSIVGCRGQHVSEFILLGNQVAEKGGAGEVVEELGPGLASFEEQGEQAEAAREEGLY